MMPSSCRGLWCWWYRGFSSRVHSEFCTSRAGLEADLSCIMYLLFVQPLFSFTNRHCGKYGLWPILIWYSCLSGTKAMQNE